MPDTLTLQSLAYLGAKRALEAAMAEANRIKIPMCIAICEVSGHAIATARMDGAPFAGAQIALDKARTVVGFNGFPTGKWWPSIKDDPALVHGITHTPGLVIFAGGLGLFHQNVLVGAIGVSGGSTADDEKIAAAGVAAL